jgi:hypothetical protein
MWPLRRVAALALAVAAPLVAGCGGGGGGSTDATTGLPAQRILDQSVAKAGELTSYKLALDLKSKTTAAPGGGSASGIGRFLGQNLSLSGEGPVRPPDASLDLTARVGAIPVQLNLTKVGGSVYLSLLGNDVKLRLPPASVSRVDLDAVRTAPLRWIADPKVVGREDLSGVPTVHIRGTLNRAKAGADLGAAVRALGGLGGANGLTPAQLARSQRELRTALKATPIDVWIGTEDLQPRRIAAKLALVRPVAALPGVRAATIDLTADLSDLNAAGNVTAPANARTVDPSSLLSALGG